MKRIEQIRTAAPTSLLTAANDALVRAWEQSHKTDRWHVLTPETIKTAHGSTGKKLDDGSILFSGPKPAKDIYTITATTTLQGVTAVRLEVMTDDSLPHKGPGRQDNGNLHLNEFRVSVRAKDGKQSEPV